MVAFCFCVSRAPQVGAFRHFYDTRLMLTGIGLRGLPEAREMCASKARAATATSKLLA